MLLNVYLFFLILIFSSTTALAGSFAQEARLLPDDIIGFESFGFDVAIDGDTLVASSPYHEHSSIFNAGAVYVYTRSNHEWVFQQKLTSSDAHASEYFGWSVEIQDDEIFVGAMWADIDAKNLQGAAYVFERSGDTWTETQKLTADDGVAVDLMGAAVAVSGDYLAVSSHLADIGAVSEQGAVYIYKKINGTWTQVQKITSDNGVANSFFGNGLEMQGDTLAVSALRQDVDGNDEEGSIYIFELSGETWSQTAQLTMSDGAQDDNFGTGISLDGDTLVGGAPGADAEENDQGAAYVFKRSGSSWTQTQKILKSNPGDNDRFGDAVYVLGNTLLITALNERGGVLYEWTYDGSTWVEGLGFESIPSEESSSMCGAIDQSNSLIVCGASGSSIESTLDGAVYTFTAPTLIDTASGLSFQEDGSAQTLTVRLSTLITDDVTLTYTGSDAITVSPSTLTFTSDNWSNPQTITVTPVVDNTVTGDFNVALSFSATSDDTNYNNTTYTLDTLSVSDVDNASITVSEVSLDLQPGQSSTQTFVLTSIPSANVVIQIATTGGLEASPSTLTFTSSNWSETQTVTFAVPSSYTITDTQLGVNALFSTASESSSVSYSVVSDDSNYNGLSLSSSSGTVSNVPLVKRGYSLLGASGCQLTSQAKLSWGSFGLLTLCLIHLWGIRRRLT